MSADRAVRGLGRGGEDAESGRKVPGTPYVIVDGITYGVPATLATVVDLVGLGAASPFPGRSLAQLWRDSPAGAVPSDAESVVVSELPAPTPNDHGRSPARRGPMLSLAEGDFVYIRNQGDGTEELFNERDDPRKLTNRARVDALNTRPPAIPKPRGPDQAEGRPARPLSSDAPTQRGRVITDAPPPGIENLVQATVPARRGRCDGHSVLRR